MEVILLQIVLTRDVAYGTDPKQAMDLYLPAKKPYPVLMWIHGGGWSKMDKSDFADLGRRFAEAGIGCAVINYRLSPAVKHPEHVKDAAAAFKKLRKDFGEARIFVGGHSAGGHLAALLTLDPAYETEVAGAILMSAPYRIPPRGGGKDMAQAFGDDPDLRQQASPVTHVKNAKAPLLVITETIADDQHQAIEQVKTFKKALADFKEATFLDARDRDHHSIVNKMMEKGDDPQRAAIVEFISP